MHPKFNPDIHHRKSIRLPNYDYSQNGYYFITICAENRKCILGKIENEKMILNQFGKIVKQQWLNLPNKFPNFKVDYFVIIPNHLHGIVVIENVGAIPCGCPEEQKENTDLAEKQQILGQAQGTAPTNANEQTKTVSDFVGEFKSLTTNEYINNVKSGNFPAFEKRIWQRNYHEHIIRNEESLNKIREYIINNPVTWEKDELFV